MDRSRADELGRPGHLPDDFALEPEYETDFVAGDIAVSVDEMPRPSTSQSSRSKRTPHSASVSRASGLPDSPSPSFGSSKPDAALSALWRTPRPQGSRLSAHERPPRPDSLAVTRDEERALLPTARSKWKGASRVRRIKRCSCRVTLGDVSGLACYKSEAGERPLWDFPDGLWRREVAAYELDVQLGTDLVPTTVARDDAPFGPGSLQWWVDDNQEDHYFTLRDRAEFHHWFARLAAFDVVANNADRKAGHVLFDETVSGPSTTACAFTKKTSCAPSSGSTRVSPSNRDFSSASTASPKVTSATWRPGSTRVNSPRAAPRARTRGKRSVPRT